MDNMISLYTEYFFKIFLDEIQYCETMCHFCVLCLGDYYEECLYSSKISGKVACGSSQKIWLN